MTTDAALEEIDGIVSRGGDADDVLRAALGVLSQLYSHVAIAFVEEGGLVEGPSVGTAESSVALSIEFQGAKVAELHVAAPPSDHGPFLERVAAQIAPYALVGWDTGGEPWQP